jgi:three-Cys-motif partner protein
MSWSEEFFNQRRLTSKLKHLVLQGYVKEFAYHLGSVQPTVYYVDGFAGAGAYVQEAKREDGSPLLVAKLAQEIKTSPRPFNLRCLNVESNRKRFISLEEETSAFRPHIIEKNYNSSFVKALADILTRIASAPAFFFIDPFGTKDIAFNDLLPIFNRSATTEVLITLHTDGIAKKAGWFAHEESANLKQREAARKFTNHLAAALDVSIEKLRDAWLDTGGKGNTEEFENRALSYYLKRLRSKRTRFRFTKPFKVLYYRETDPFREMPVCFNLVFATGHERGLFEMNDAMVVALDAFYRAVYSATFFPIFAAQREQQIGAVAVQRTISSRFSAKPFTIDDVKRYCMQETEYLLKGAEYRKLVLEMARNGELKKLDKGTPNNSQTRFTVAGVTA